MSDSVVETMLVQILQHCARLKWVVQLVWTFLRPAEASTCRSVAAGRRRKLCSWERQEHFLMCSGWPLHSVSCKSQILGLVCVVELPPQWTRSFSSCASLVPNCVLWRTLTLRLNESFCSCAVLKWRNAWASCRIADPLGTRHTGLKVCHPRCVRSIIQNCSVFISIYTYSHEHNNITISSNI